MINPEAMPELPIAAVDMSIRDEFALAILRNVKLDELHFGTQSFPENPWPWVATQCYAAADAMLAAREGGK